jgi:DNA polymerase-1
MPQHHILVAVPAPLLVADAPALLYRAFFALPDSIKGEGGRPVNALLGSVNQMLQVIEQRQPRAAVLCFGPDSATYRTDAFPAYHAHRPPMPDALAEQWARAPELYEAFGWTVLDHDAVEADDLLGSLATIESAAGGETLILTGDRDLFQCATGDVTVLLQGGGKGEPQVVTPEEVQRRYGIAPAQVPDFIALRGDPSDGIPGAKGIGEKTAADILRRHGSLEAAIDGAVRESKPTVRRALIEQADELRMFKDIAMLRHIELERPADAPTDTTRGGAAARALGLKRLAERLDPAS